MDKAATVGLDPVTLGWACALPCKTIGSTEVFSLEGGCDVIKCRKCNKVQNIIPNMEPGQHSFHIDKFLKDIARVNVNNSIDRSRNLAKMNNIVWKAFHFDGLLNMLELCRGDAAKVRECVQKLTHDSLHQFSAVVSHRLHFGVTKRPRQQPDHPLPTGSRNWPRRRRR